MIKTIQKYFKPKYLKIYDNSAYHKIKNNKKHIVIFIVSNKFINKNSLQRQKKMYFILSKKFKNTIYAISMYTYTTKEWYKKKIKYIPNIICQN
ncbi:BolA family protein [Buchnera aphidicola]|uniref:BolA family transcriptional regulator n=1 Tax=Buchnera aphidicola (Stegophylla sp.) TaxID=2315800 RepID=A0A4D6YAJ3_9GAMM|nr:BolA family transcriptional regulator [Buchnera aphidicola (Stegophylla sp.)]QCI26449.1 BolA family transcriptional regulator [Buchnera aphidicola (Stegophylla sp.)]